MTTATDTKTEEEIELSAQATKELRVLDRCDRCGAQAYIRAILKNTGGELLFCGHHGRAVESALRPQTSLWQDETGRLIENKLKGSEN